MALLSIRGDWHLYLWLIYRKIYSAVIWLLGNHCRGDKSRSVISVVAGSQSLAGLHRVRTRRRKPQQHRNKHVVALVRRPSLRRIVMAPGASTAHAMMEDKEKALSNVSMRRRRISQFAPLLIALVGLPARGKSQLAHRLSRHLNWNGESTKVFDCSEYRRRHMAMYGSHDIFRADNLQGSAIRSQSAREAVQDAVLWLKDGNSVAIFDGTNVTKEQRRELNECITDMGFRILFIECVCEDQELLERNIIEILHYSADYKTMTEEEAIDDLRKKLEHYMRQYEPIDANSEALSFVRVENMGDTVTAHKVSGQKESGILGYLSGMRALPQTLYFTRHGESEYNVVGRIGGDAVLSPRGESYAHGLAVHLNELAAHEPLTVWTSELRRTKQTAADIMAPKRAIRALNELDAGICEGLTYEEMQERFPQEFAWRDQDKLRYRYPWGESYIDIMTRLRPVLSALEDEHNVVVVGHQAVLRCMLGYFLDAQLDELPYMNVPLHTIVKLTSYGYKYKLEMIKLPIDCVDTHRKQPKNCSINRTTADALVTVPSHYDTLPSNMWQNSEAQL
ncbi:6-phosphofructo-2-kinase/fructose-2,6-bisphosphatase [Bicyclus anynana]|uniref:6-phosphofructo-2-kinase/fructose-2, 6-bisphosphatase-like isoform X1 n=1 Tax=Bicyclus anynana TaxID=110368 RepID=A0A6J1MWM9_BICAN|nr:6-phosphofructo-2-kinase/fructose-2,6-bisphosphatase [Bicyclus anynana]XP_023937274.1 6-phosphofructo-2-kinase/fructose-2,6-bisphosphatase [Bicyclus anynana]